MNCQNRSPPTTNPGAARAQSADLGRVFNLKQVGGRGADKGGHTLDGVTYFGRPDV